ncbi:hypothetical protein [Anaerovorax odorimutans]|nr:hypothetical protein [Anaerovorax odorimutans]
MPQVIQDVSMISTLQQRCYNHRNHYIMFPHSAYSFAYSFMTADMIQ